MKKTYETLENVSEIVVSQYNTICKSLPRVIKVTDKRKKDISRAAKELREIGSTFEELFEKAESSAFLTGNNTRGFKANFDFILRSSTMIKILEGAYGGCSKGKNTNRSYDIEALENFSIFD